MTPQCACAPGVPGFGTHVSQGLFSLVPRILNPFPVLAWREKLFLAIFTCFFFFPLLSSLLCTYDHLIQYIFYLLIVYLLSLECKLYEGMDFVYFCLLLYPHGKNSAWLMLGTQLINKSKAFHLEIYSIISELEKTKKLYSSILNLQMKTTRLPSLTFLVSSQYHHSFLF